MSKMRSTLKAFCLASCMLLLLAGSSQANANKYQVDFLGNGQIYDVEVIPQGAGKYDLGFSYNDQFLGTIALPWSGNFTIINVRGNMQDLAYVSLGGSGGYIQEVKIFGSDGEHITELVDIKEQLRGQKGGRFEVDGDRILFKYGGNKVIPIMWDRNTNNYVVGEATTLTVGPADWGDVRMGEVWRETTEDGTISVKFINMSADGITVHVQADKYRGYSINTQLFASKKDRHTVFAKGLTNQGDDFDIQLIARPMSVKTTIFVGQSGDLWGPVSLIRKND